jgi:hypothetical protein
MIHDTCLTKVGTECDPDLSSLPTLFGVSLSLLVKASSGPPFLLKKCITEIDKRGLTVEGIYRISGSRDAGERLKAILENGENLGFRMGKFDFNNLENLQTGKWPT